MRAPHRGRHSAAVMLATWLGLIVGLGLLAATYAWRHGAHATTPPAPAITPSLEPAPPRVYEYIDGETGCHYLGSSLGGITPRLNANGLHWCGK